MLIKKPTGIKSSEITNKELYLNRREFMAMAAASALTRVGGDKKSDRKAGADKKLPVAKRGEYIVMEKNTSFRNVSTYNNYYEFTTEKEGIDELAKEFRTRPWTVTIKGHVKNPSVIDIDKIMEMFPLEERIYRFRCVEAWSMVIPWIGFPLGDLIKRYEPSSKAGFVKFTTVLDPAQMPGQRRQILDWPYVEALRIDEAVHPLTILSVGMYGEILPNQNGAPLRLIVPWKYGFKCIKSIVKIEFVEKIPVTSWVKANPAEYGFYANVNPNVDHPRWSQAKERRIGEFRKRKTLMFNGYSEQVAYMYKGMDLKRLY